MSTPVLDRLLAEGLLTPKRLEECRRAAERSGQPLEQVVLEKGAVPEAEFLRRFAEAQDLPFQPSLAGAVVPESFTTRVPSAFARNNALVAIGLSGGAYRVACASPLSLHPLDELSALLDAPVRVVLAPREEVSALVNRAYANESGVVDEMLEGLKADDLEAALEETGSGEDLLNVANKAPIIKLVNTVIFQALKMRASDIHFQAYEDKLQIRHRIDGILYDMMTVPKKTQEAVISRIKVMGQMDIAERRLPQDGGCSIKAGDRDVDIRISSVPTNFGERVVLRLQDKSTGVYALEKIGLSPENLETIKRLTDLSHGIILVTGPTGSGKTTTLYAALSRINTAELNILTIEEPIEYQLRGISQIEVANKKGLTFATGLRSIVRQDPDVIMVGEVRDLETAEIAIQSALTGHLVFSTLHTNDAPGAVTRLVDLGVEPFLVASSVVAVVAQRLVRVICTACKEEYAPEPQPLLDLGIDPAKAPKLWRGRGCPDCLNSGYKGRTAIYEFLLVDDVVRERVMTRASSSMIKREAVDRGMRTLRMDGAAKVLSGLTTVEEVARMTQRDGF